VVETVVCTDAGQAASAAARVGYPVVAKVDHVSLQHKSDVGGVRVGLADEEQVRSAVAELLVLAPGARVLIQPLVAGLELVVGGLREPTFGPVVGFGLGGILVEVLDDVSFAAAPLDDAAALALMERPRGAVLLDGVRGAGPVDRAAVATVIRAVGDLMATWPEIAELDLNPLMVGPSGVVAVDARLVRG
jgi:acetyltransferase